MKKRLLAVLTVVALLATMVCISSMPVSAGVTKYETLVMDYGHADWFDTEKAWAEFVTTENGVSILDWSVSGGNVNGQGNWNRKQYGQYIIKTETEQYLRLFKLPDTAATYAAGVQDSNFYFFTNSCKNSAGLPDPLKVTIKLRKVGEDWTNGNQTNCNLQIQYYCSGPGWGLTTVFNDELFAGPMNEWFEITKEVMVPETYANADSIQVQYRFGANNDAELHIQSVTSSYPLDMANIPEIDPETAAFDGANPADVTVAIDLKGFSLSPIKLDGKAIAKANYALSAAKDSLTFNKEYLATLENGEYVFLLSTPGGECTLTLTVTNAKPAEQGGNEGGNEGGNGGGEQGGGEEQKGGCGGIITATSAILATMALAGAVLVFKKKED